MSYHAPMHDPATITTTRGHLLTEQRLTASAAIDALSVEAMLRLINTQDMDVPRAVRDAIPRLTTLIEDLVERMKRGGRLIYVGAGTSGRLGVLDASECPPTFHCDAGEVVGVIAGGDAALRRSSEGREDDPAAAREELDRLKLTPDDMVVGIAAGGTTPCVWGALAYAKEATGGGAATALVCCVPLKSLMTRARAPVVKPNEPTPLPEAPKLPAKVDHVVELLVGPEVLTGSTRMKAGTATKLALNMITTTAMVQRGKAWGNLMVDLRASNAKLRDRALRVLSSQTDLPRDRAAALLEQAGGRVKPALVMARLRCGAAEAEAELAKHGGKLRPILGPPR